MANTKKKFRIRVNYKSGISEEFDVYSFSINGDVYNWEPVHITEKPILIGVDDIESVWQVGYTPAQEL